MPKQSKRLVSTDREVATAKRPIKGVVAEYRVKGVPGLVLRVTRTGTRAWTHWIKRPSTGRWTKYRIGPYPTVTFARAKEEAVRLRRQVIDGIDPFAVQVVDRNTLTIRALGERFVERTKAKCRTWRETERILQINVDLVLGDMRADRVTTIDIVRMLDKIEDRGAGVMANRTLSLVRRLFNWAFTEGLVDIANPAQRIPRRVRETARRRVLDEAELKMLWTALDDGAGFDPVTGDSLRLAILLGARIGEITGMKRDELEGDTWRLPASRSKSGHEVVRPLPPMAKRIIERRLKAAKCSPFVFASPNGGTVPITSRAPAKALRRAAERALVPASFSPHDLRRTARTFWAQLGVSPDIARRLLGHTPPTADIDARVYDRFDHQVAMADALARWERLLLEIERDVGHCALSSSETPARAAAPQR